jgi:FkbM family methyltransferase
MIDLLKVLLKEKDGLFIDVGANVGQSLLKLKSVSSTAKYIGFEPNPSCVFYMTHLIKKNFFHDVLLIPVAISDKNEIKNLVFYSESETDSAASVLPEFRKSDKIKKTEFIPSMNIDSLSSIINMDDCSVLKIDVEGFELEVIKSFSTIIKKSFPFIIMEILPVYDESNSFRFLRQKEIVQTLKDCGYLIYRIMKKKTTLLGLNLLNEIEIHSNIEFCDYLFVHENKHNKIFDLIIE